MADRTCRGCGCTDSQACPRGCSWVLLDVDCSFRGLGAVQLGTGVCSACAEAAGWNQEALMYGGWENVPRIEDLQIHLGSIIRNTSAEAVGWSQEFVIDDDLQIITDEFGDEPDGDDYADRAEWKARL